MDNREENRNTGNRDDIRKLIAFEYCQKKGWPHDPDALSWEQIYEIRHLPEWIRADWTAAAGNKDKVSFYRHWVEANYMGEWGQGSFRHSELDAEDFVKQEDEYCRKWTHGKPSVPITTHRVVFTHEISKEDYEARKIYTTPIRQIIFMPCCCFK